MSVTKEALFFSLVFGFGAIIGTYSGKQRVVTIVETCYFEWNDNPTKIPAEHYGRKNYIESVEQFGAPDKVECE